MNRPRGIGWCLPVALGLLAVGCAHSHSSPPPVLASAVIGPEGGVLVVSGGKQDGLALLVPPGALSTTQEIRVLDSTLNLLAVTDGPLPGFPFLIEPKDLQLAQPARLRMPYRPQYVVTTSPSNVRVVLQAVGQSETLEPTHVDAYTAMVEVMVSTFGYFRVVVGPVADSTRVYWPEQQPTTQLEGGWSFAVEAVPTGAPFGPFGTERWRIHGPDGEELLYVTEGSLLARESVTGNWRERWDDPYFLWQDARVALPAGLTTTIHVESPIGIPPLGGQMTAYAVWSYSTPQLLGEQLLTDVVRLRLSLAWDRPDSGIGQKEYLFDFAPGLGLVAMSIDGVRNSRLPQ